VHFWVSAIVQAQHNGFVKVFLLHQNFSFLYFDIEKKTKTCLSALSFHLTFKVERLIPPRVQRPPFDLCLEPMLLVGQEGHAHVGVAQAVGVLGCKVAGLKMIKK
jgi:hypothetical protein